MKTEYDLAGKTIGLAMKIHESRPVQENNPARADFDSVHSVILSKK